MYVCMYVCICYIHIHAIYTYTNKYICIYIYTYTLLRNTKEVSNFLKILYFYKVCIFLVRLKTDKAFNFLCQQMGSDIWTIQKPFRSSIFSEFIHMTIYFFILILIGITIAWINIVWEARNTWKINKI